MSTVSTSLEQIALGDNGQKKCSALSLVDEKPCDTAATSTDGLFCVFHSKQCHGLYMGYKNRNAKLDELRSCPPKSLASRSTKLANDFFDDLGNESALSEIHDHLLQTYRLLDRVIKARKLHHSHFYAQTMDYGHQKYLDTLLQQKVTVAIALERVTRRTAEVLYKKRKWFQWTRKCQEEDEKVRDNEKRKIKREAALFRRQMKEVERRMRELRLREEKRRQEDFLQKAYEERLEHDAESWDPIEDVLENERGNYVDLIEHFLWLKGEQPEESEKHISPQEKAINVETPNVDVSPTSDSRLEQSLESESKKKGKRRKGKALAPVQPDDSIRKNSTDATPAETDAAVRQPVFIPAQSEEHKSTKEMQIAVGKIESREEVRQRLIEGMKIENGVLLLRGTIDEPELTSDRVPPIPADEADRLLDEISEIKNFLFCRLLLGNAALLPAAMRSSTVHELFKDPDVSVSDLRDICLKMEQPQLQDIRDACADFFRSNDENDELSSSAGDDSEEETDSDEDEEHWLVSRSRRENKIPSAWKSKREKKLSAQREKATNGLGYGPAAEGEGAAIDFGDLDEEKPDQRKIRVKLCGRRIYHYPSSKSMSRGGWLHFSIIAKDCSFFRALELCKSWEEFFEVNVLAINNYFPSPYWLLPTGHLMHRQLLTMGFIPFYMNTKGSMATFSESERIHGRGRVHATREVRNYICAQMCRSDPATRRFLQYVSMQTSRMMLVVRDAKTGKIIVKPPDDQAWLFRERMGHGRASRTPWKITKRVDEAFFTEMEERRAFRLGFDDFYDVYIWSTAAGQRFSALHSGILEMLCKAHRVTRPSEILTASATYLKTLTTDLITGRVRDIKPDEQVDSLYDMYESEDTVFRFISTEGTIVTGLPRRLQYNEADILEDAILFPEDSTGKGSSGRLKELTNELSLLEKGRIKHFAEAFAYDLDTDEEYNSEEWASDTDYEEEDWTESDFSETNSQHEEEEVKSEDTSHKPQGDEIHKATDESLDKALTSVFGQLLQALDDAQKIYDEFGPGPNDAVNDEDLKPKFMEFLDRHKARVFKETWHRADLDPESFPRWNELAQIRDKITECVPYMAAMTVPMAKMLRFLNCHPTSHSRVRRDGPRAYMMTALFFPIGSTFFQEPEGGAEIKDSLLFKQEERSKLLPDRRGHQSSSSRGNEFFEEFDQIVEKCKKNKSFLADEVPLEWSVILRPKIAQLFNAGVIGLSYELPEHMAGLAFVGREKDKPADLFFDFRATISETDVRLPPGRQNPDKITVTSLRKNIQSRTASRPKARFSLLRVWSASHFYPLMIGHNNRQWTAFADTIARTWEWKFVPKDMPYSEFSMHNNLCQRLEPYMDMLRDKIVIKRDMVLVMAEDEEALLLLTSAVVFAIQTKPWRLEVDFWKSFINVDAGFLEGLRDEWFE
ncbi:hypothetical protein FQN52_000501 [Onygenales sp. PD_12]|nr:hypothetical protein FQN53_004989 [Emmonsiellopsis sp. PD_33]KAK2782949.1 hypothetical protein FQN52_000501 [Onygenales sp. PD_12]KAK2805202.1 hypothetical protein FQN51_000725 [Onygenales sp. PD_10]